MGWGDLSPACRPRHFAKTAKEEKQDVFDSKNFCIVHR
jgi:hypothetical protein